MKNSLLLAALLALPFSMSVAQRKDKAKSKTETAPAPVGNPRLQPLFGGISAAEAEKLVGPAFLADVERSFASRTEASAFFANKGFEYLAENQPDTATYRFNLAWLLNPQNADAYRGLGVVVSRNSSPDQAIDLLLRAVALAPKNTMVLSDLGASYLIRYEQGKKKKDLTAGMNYLQQAVAADPANAVAWQQLARGYYFQEQYAQAWEAVHKGQSLSVASIDFGFISELLAKQPDPQGTFK